MRLVHAFEELCRAAAPHSDDEGIEAALARFEAFSRGYADLASWAHEHPPEPALDLLAGRREVDGRELELRARLSSVELGIDAHAPLHPAQLDALEAHTGKRWPLALRELFLCAGTVTFTGFGALRLDANDLPPLNEALSEWLSAMRADHHANGVLLFAGDLEEGWALRLSDASPTVYRFRQEVLLAHPTELPATLSLEAVAANPRRWLSAHVDRLIRAVGHDEATRDR